MGLEFYIKDKKAHRFQQSNWLTSNNQATMGGACLALSFAFVHLRRQGLSPSDIFCFLQAGKFRDTVIGIQQEYLAGDSCQELFNYILVSSSILKKLVEGGYAEPRKAVLTTLGEYFANPDDAPDAKGKVAKRRASGHLIERHPKEKDAKQGALSSEPKFQPPRLRPNMTMDLLTGLHPRPHKLILLIFNCRGGNISSIPGAHAIVMEDLKGTAGIFDPNFGWMELRSGYNSIDLSLMLQTFKTEYDITDAHSIQDVT